jgi:hypothetical protein
MQIALNNLPRKRLVVFVDYPSALYALRRVEEQIDLAALRDCLAECYLGTFVYAVTHPLTGLVP